MPIKIRENCPVCGGKNTYTAAYINGLFVWNCYRASCDNRGARRAVLTKDNLNELLPSLVSESTKSEKNHNDRLDPEFYSYTTIENYGPAIDLVKKWNAYQVYKEGKVLIEYDILKDRVIFFVTDYKHTIVDVVGRALKKDQVKWIRYNNSQTPLVIQRNPRSKTVVLVEDAFSAASVARVANSAALMGTFLSIPYINTLCKEYKFNNFIVCLDRDATVKALAISKKLSSVAKACVRFLDRDLKFIDSTLELETILKLEKYDV